MKTENKHKTYEKPAIQVRPMAPIRFLAGSDTPPQVHSNAFEGMAQGTEYDEGR